MMRKYLKLAPAGAMLFLSACVVGPNYRRPAAVAPPAFKEQPPPNFKEAQTAGWKQAQPGGAYLKGKWWEVYRDPALNALEEQVVINNQNVAQAEAQYRQAKALVRVSRAALYPTVTGGVSVSGSGTIGSANSGNIATNSRHAFQLRSALRCLVGAGSLGKPPSRCHGGSGHGAILRGRTGERAAFVSV